MGGRLAPAEKPKSTETETHTREKFVNYRDHGSPENQNDKTIRILAGHILQIICYIDQQRWKEAHEALNAKNVAESCGMRIDSPIKVFDNLNEAIVYARGKAMWYRELKKVLLPQVAIAKKGTPEEFWKFPFELPELANKIFPIWLEEWIHAFQFFLAGPLCDETIEFGKSSTFKKNWDLNEVDVFAIYRDLGWDKEMLKEMELLYDERIAFAKFCKKENSNNVMYCCEVK